MRKFLFSTTSKFKFVVLFSAFVLLLQNTSNAQCGLSAFADPAGTLTPTNSWQNVNTGAGTYVDFNVSVGNIYSFRYASGTSNLGNLWDMTFSATSTAIVYNNSLSPVRDSWTGGQGCPNTTQPTSCEWYANFNGVARINTHSYSGGCLPGWVNGQTSALLQYKTCPAAADPGYGINVWNVDAYATTDVTIPNTAARYGYYVDNLGTDFATTNYYAAGSAVSTAPGWTGCSEIPLDNVTVRARRTGFPCNRYIISFNAGDDISRVFINGVLSFSSNAPSGTPVQIADMVLSANDNIEIRQVGLCGPDYINVGIAPQGLPALSGGTIGGPVDGSIVCAGATFGNYTNVTSPSGGTIGLTNGGVPVYDWEVSVDGGATYLSAGVNSLVWNSVNTVPPGYTFTVRRKVTDLCGNVAYSNTITVIGKDEPNGSMSPLTQTICPGTSAALTLNFTPGTEPFNITFSDGVSSYSRTGVRSGDTIMVTPSINTTYNFTLIADSFGCSRASGFTSGAQVLVLPGFSINATFTNVLCNGGNTGTITVVPNGGTAPFQYSIDGGATFQNSGVFTGLTIGTYNVVVVDNSGCTVPYGSPIVITEPTDITQTLSATDASCANVFDGSITVTASGGVPSYTYSLNQGPAQFSPTFTGVAAGNYTVSVYDANGCVDTSSISVGNTYIISVTETAHTDLTCFGYGNGSTTVQVNGGVAPYQYSLNGTPFQSSNTFSGLAAGTYIVTGRDSKGCTEFATVVITQPSPITVTVDAVTNLLCAANANGTVNITVTGGNPGGYTYNWNNGAYNTEDLTGLTAGIYNLVVTDVNNCSATASATVTEPLALFLNVASFNNVGCSGDTSGTIDITANGGIPAYTYSWSNGKTSEDLINLSGGSYSVTVTDANGCTQTITQVLTEPNPLTATIVGTDAVCSYTNDGSADLTPGGGTAPYSFLWSTFDVSEDVTGLGGGLYHVIITDRNGCQLSDTVRIHQAAPIVLTTLVTNVSCAGQTNGAIDLTVNGGTPNYTYAWTGNTLATTQDLTNLNGGNYHVVVTDANSCTAATSATVLSPSPIGALYVITNPKCYGEATGAIDLTPFGGTPGSSPQYTFQWSNGATTEDISGDTADIYNVTITDSKGCTKVIPLTMLQPAPLSVSGIVKNITCFGSNDAMVLTNAYGGTPPYSYNWVDSTTNQVISNGPFIKDRPAGDYYLHTFDANGCEAVSFFRLVEPAQLVANVTGNDATCFGQCNGQATVVAVGGRTPYSYLWNNFDTATTVNSLCAGHISVVVTDSSGCKTYDSIAIGQPADIIITGVVTDVLCNGQNTGAIDATITGGVPPYVYAWSNGQTTEDLTGLAAGTYTLTVTDANTCSRSKTFTLIQLVSLTPNVVAYSPTCHAGDNGFITVDVSGGTVPYTYAWNTTPAQTGNTAVNLTAGTYVVTITDANACSVSVSTDVTDPDSIAVSVVIVDAKCYNTATGMVIGSATGGKPPYSFELNGIIQVSDTFRRLMPGQYVLGVHDANGCTGTTVFTINAPLPLTVDLTAPEAVILEGMQTQLIATASPGVTDYYWGPGYDSVFNPNFVFDVCHGDSIHCPNPFVAPRTTTVFYVTVMNVDSCYATDTTVITVLHQPSAFIPTAFSPNGDGLNDRFEFDILGSKNIALTIYSRWGNVVYSTDNQTNGTDCRCGWDGTLAGKAMPYDTYVYKMKVTYFDDRVEDRAGTVTIMK